MSKSVINPYQQFLDEAGVPVSSGTVTFFINTTATIDSIFSDEALTIAQANPYMLDAAGRIRGDVKYNGKKTLQLKDRNGATIRTLDDIAAPNSNLASDINYTTTATVADYLDDQPITFDTVADYKAYAFLLTVGKVVRLLDRGDDFLVISGTGTANTFNIIASDVVAQSVGLIILNGIHKVGSYGAVDDNLTGLTDSTGAIAQAITDWRAATSATLYFGAKSYVSKAVLNFSNLGSAVKRIRGEKTWIDFQDLANAPALVDCLNSKELNFEYLRFRYKGAFDDAPSTAPEVGILIARNVGNDFSGRHEFNDVRVSGIYQLASFYNSGCEEILYTDVEFRNTLTERRSCVVTCSNHLGATSAFGDITVSAISTTLNTFIQPAFYSDGNTRENVCIRGAGGLTMINPYSSSGGFAHYAIQGIDQSCSAIKILGYQCEVDRGSTGISADYAFRFEGDGTLDITGSDFTQQFTTVVIDEMVLETLRDFKRNTINTGRGITTIGTTTNVEACEIRASAGVDFTNITNVLATKIYSELRSTIILPTSSKACDITANDLDSPIVIGKFKSRTTAGTVNLDEALIGFSGAGTIANFTSDFTGLPVIAQTLYGFCISASMTIEHGTGNIRTNTSLDIVLTANQYVEIIYNGNADKYYVRYMGG